MASHRSVGSRPVALLLATALGGAPVTTMAAPAPEGETAEVAANPEPLAEAQKLYERGRAKFETADYQAAVELWTEAYAQVPDNSDGAQIRVLLIFNIATARERAFDVTQDPAELRQAKILLGNFEKSIPAIYGEGAEADAERARVQEKVAALDERLAAYEASQEPDPVVVTPPPEPDPDPEPVEDNSRGLIIGGAVAAGIGVIGLGVMGAGLSIGASANDITDLEETDVQGRRDQFDRGRTGNRLALVGGIGGGALLVTGAVLLALGLKRKKAGGAVSLVPTANRNSAALMLRGRF